MEEKEIIKNYQAIYRRSVNDIKYHAKIEINKINEQIRQGFTPMLQEIEALNSECKEKLSDSEMIIKESEDA